MTTKLYKISELVIIPRHLEVKDDLRLPINILFMHKENISDTEFSLMVESLNKKYMEEDKRNNKRCYDIPKLGVDIDPKWLDLDFLESLYEDQWIYDYKHAEDNINEYVKKRIDDKYIFFNLNRIIDELVNQGYILIDMSVNHEEIIY